MLVLHRQHCCLGMLLLRGCAQLLHGGGADMCPPATVPGQQVRPGMQQACVLLTFYYLPAVLDQLHHMSKQ